MDRFCGYSERALTWLQARGELNVIDPADPRAVIGTFAALLQARDHHGTASVVLPGIERSHAAWVQLVNQEMAPIKEVAPFLAELMLLGDEVAKREP